MRKPASREIISASVELCETDVCFMRIKLIGTNVWLPKKAQKSLWFRFWVLEISDKSQSLETVPTCMVVRCFPHDKIVWLHMCDECKRSNLLNVSRKLWLTQWQHVQVCSRTIECLVYRSLTNRDISRQFESIFVTIHTPFLILPCTVAQPFYSLARNIAPHNSLHDLPYHRTMKRCPASVSVNKVAFQ